MDRKEFMKKVKKLHVPNYWFNLDGVGCDDERLCLVKAGEKWNVYYAERGCKTTNKFFDTESDALTYMLERLSE
ncbi:MAG: hypothetical protein MRZ25_02790 [Ruminococcus sp.]|nr:hypothetical protein [Ruminococcus sp.]MDD6446554.1 hypothetical protein [Ruminococcus sp.]MDY2857273.1 hypothetical protein [Oscillospiraceae bacterium]